MPSKVVSAREAHELQVQRAAEQNADIRAKLARTSRRFGMDLSDDILIQQWRGEARHGPTIPTYRGST